MPAAARAWTLGAVAAAISLAFSWVPSYWSDEVATVRAARLPLGQLFAFVTLHFDAGHALYYLGVRAWAGVFGFTELGTRSFSALGVGVATALVALIGQRLGRPRLALLAAGVFAVMPRTTWAGAEARSAAWSMALAAAAWLLLLIALERGGWWWVALGAAAAVMTATFVLTATICAARLLYVLMLRRGAAWRTGLTWLGAFVVASPVLYLGWQQRGQIGWLGRLGAFTPWTVLVEPWGESAWGYGLAVWALLVVGAVRWRHALRRSGSEWLLLGAAWFGVPMVITVAVSLVGSPIFAARFLAFAMPGLAFLMAAAVGSLRSANVGRLAVRGRGWVVAASAIALLALAAPGYIGQRMPFAKPGASDLRLVADTVAAHSRKGDAFAFDSWRARGATAVYPRAFAGLTDIALETPFPASRTFRDLTVPLAQRTEQLETVSVVLLVENGARASCTASHDARTVLGAGFQDDGRFPTRNETVCRFTRTDNAP